MKYYPCMHDAGSIGGQCDLSTTLQVVQEKRTVQDLAYFGGDPLFPSIKPIGQLARPDREIFFRYARKMYEGRRCTNNGPIVRELEERLRVLHGTSHCVAFANACLGIVASMQILAPTPGEVIMPSFTYAGLPHLALWAGHTPHYCDVDQKTHVLDPDKVSEAISSKTALILAVHQVNSPCDIYRLEELAEAHGVPVVFDAVHGIGCSYDGKDIGCFGRAEIFSLHATKLINGFEGGYVTTNDDVLAAELRVIRNFGFTGRDTIMSLGMNAKLNEIHASMALAVLENMDEIIEYNKKVYLEYLKSLNGVAGVKLVGYEGDEKYNYEHCIIRIDGSWILERDQIVRLMKSERVLAQPYYSPPLHLSKHSPDNTIKGDLPITEMISKQHILLPVGELVEMEDIRKIAALIQFLHSNQISISERLGQEQKP